MNINTNYVNDKNNYAISLDIDTAIFSCRMCLNGQNYFLEYPTGTTRQKVVDGVKNMFEEASDD